MCSFERLQTGHDQLAGTVCQWLSQSNFLLPVRRRARSNIFSFASSISLSNIEGVLSQISKLPKWWPMGNAFL